MLNNYQIQYLAKLTNLNLYYIDDTTISGIGKSKNENIIKCPYENFKVGMGLSDIRFHWLLGDNNFMAGGNVLNWIWGENKNEDVDFFFKNAESAENFILFLESVGARMTKETGYARTLFEEKSKAIIQVVGNINNSAIGVPHGEISEILGSFDIEVCKFAVDVENVYFTQAAIQHLIRLQLETTESIKPDKAIYRINKYIKKGFYPGSTVLSGLKYARKTDIF